MHVKANPITGQIPGVRIWHFSASHWETATQWNKQSNKGQPSRLGNLSRCETTQLLLWLFVSLALGITGEPLHVPRAAKMLLIKQPLPMQGEETEV